MQPFLWFEKKTRNMPQQNGKLKGELHMGQQRITFSKRGNYTEVVKFDEILSIP